MSDSPTIQPDLPRRPADAAAAAFALVYPTLLTLVFFVALAGAAAAVQQSVFLAGKSLQFVFPAFWVFIVQRRRLSVRCTHPTGLGLRCAATPALLVRCTHPTGRRRMLLPGLLFGAAVFAGIVVLYHAWLKPAGLLSGAGQNIAAKLAGFGLEGPAAFLILAACYSLLHSFLEEYYWRWFAFGQLRRWIPLWPAIIVSALGFTGHHVVVLWGYFGGPTWPTLVFSAAVAVGGGFWAWLYARSGSLLGPWLSHVLIDAALFAVGWDMLRP